MQTEQALGARAWWALRIGAAGVVYGDIGTSPLYTWNEARHTGALTTPADILGAASLVFWTVTLAITIKYVGLVLRADNQGEGGTFALMGLLQRHPFRGRPALLGLLAFAACLLYADGLITPAISVLSAVEGLTVANPGLAPFVLPASLAILTGVFATQFLGTARLGTVFGVVILLWFSALVLLGARQVAAHPAVLQALLPHHALGFLARHTVAESAAMLGAVVLAITGGEALYADLGHFGAKAIRQTWNVVAWPALVLNYLGQGAFLLGGGEVVGGSVFYSTVPRALMFPAIALATAATVIASQALISGAFSLTRSAINLGLLPRTQVVHTSEHVEGQIYLPAVNLALWAGCCVVVVVFGSSSALAAAYGLAVMGVVTTTTLSLAFLARHQWGWGLGPTALVFGGFLVFDGAYLAANAVKLADGAWVPLALAGALYLVMWTWRTGRAQLAEAYRRLPRVPISALLGLRDQLVTMPRAMVFLVSEPVRAASDPAPVLLLKFVDRYGALPKHVTLFTVVPLPEVPRHEGERFEVTSLGSDVVSVRMRVGFMEQPDVRAALRDLKRQGAIRIHAVRWTIVSGVEEIVTDRTLAWWSWLTRPGEALWLLRLRLFRQLMGSSAQIHRWFGLGSDTGVSKEVVPVRASPHGMAVALDPSSVLELVADRPPAERPLTAEPPADSPPPAR